MEVKRFMYWNENGVLAFYFDDGAVIPEGAIEITPEEHLRYYSGKYKMNLETMEVEEVILPEFIPEPSEVDILRERVTMMQEVLDFMIMN